MYIINFFFLRISISFLNEALRGYIYLDILCLWSREGFVKYLGWGNKERKRKKNKRDNDINIDAETIL